MALSRRRVAVFAAVLLVASAGWWQFVRREVPQGQRPLVTLDVSGLAGLREEFNASSDAARVIVLLAPT